jgi:rare lipoprotein A
MARFRRHALGFAAVSVLAAGCATHPSGPSGVSLPPSAGVYKIGNPYQIAGTWYYPHEQPDYDETGVASWYGPTFYGKHTADGEVFDADALTAAHRTLPMPVNVRVTNLENGKSLVVRVNDRGPFAKSRIIDLSEHAAKLLGYYNQGTARVRVTYLGRADLPNGEPQSPETPARIATALPPVPAAQVAVTGLSAIPDAPVAPPTPLKQMPLPAPSTPTPNPAANTEPTGVVTEVPVPAVTHLYVQAGAFSSYDNARRMQGRLAGAGALSISSIDRNGQRLYRVRMGPFDAVADADAALARVTSQGGADARIVVDR